MRDVAGGVPSFPPRLGTTPEAGLMATWPGGYLHHAVEETRQDRYTLVCPTGEITQTKTPPSRGPLRQAGSPSQAMPTRLGHRLVPNYNGECNRPSTGRHDRSTGGSLHLYCLWWLLAKPGTLRRAWTDMTGSPTHRGNRTKCSKNVRPGQRGPRTDEGPRRSPRSPWGVVPGGTPPPQDPPLPPLHHPTRTRPARPCPVAGPIPRAGPMRAPSPPSTSPAPPKGSPCAHEQRTHPRSPAPTLPSQSPVACEAA